MAVFFKGIWSAEDNALSYRRYRPRAGGTRTPTPRQLACAERPLHPPTQALFSLSLRLRRFAARIVFQFKEKWTEVIPAIDFIAGVAFKEIQELCQCAPFFREG